MRDERTVWNELREWLKQLGAAEEERQRLAPPQDFSDLSEIEPVPLPHDARAIEEYLHLVEQRTELLAEYLAVNQ